MIFRILKGSLEIYETLKCLSESLKAYQRFGGSVKVPKILLKSQRICCSPYGLLEYLRFFLIFYGFREVSDGHSMSQRVHWRPILPTLVFKDLTKSVSIYYNPWRSTKIHDCPWRSLQDYLGLWMTTEVIDSLVNSIEVLARLSRSLDAYKDSWKFIEVLNIYHNPWKSPEVLKVNRSIWRSTEASLGISRTSGDVLEPWDLWYFGTSSGSLINLQGLR